MYSLAPASVKGFPSAYLQLAYMIFFMNYDHPVKEGGNVLGSVSRTFYGRFYFTRKLWPPDFT